MPSNMSTNDPKTHANDKCSGKISPMPSPTLSQTELAQSHADRKVWKKGEKKPSETWAELSGKVWKGYT